MSKTKYMMSGGLAFAESTDMEKLRQQSLKGWHVKKLSFMGYTLVKGEKKEYIYSIDYRTVEETEEEEYLSYFEDAGWKHVFSEAGIHLFRAAPGTEPIYSDKETLAQKHEESLSNTARWVGALVVFAISYWTGTILTTGMIANILTVVAVILTILAIPAVWTAMKIQSNKWKVQGKQKSVFLMNTMMILIFATLTISLLYVNGPNDAIKTLAYMLIGATLLPTLIWFVFSLYYKVAGR
ncbi:DUF2812 domain-containing protein [Cytobacillus sp. Sa5YUA1]|uniref:DUF2812 domain-containing protein n=1 Tax=Cytobacillus stercorigallinarum TaxID=2762240 RepID=A0ABR8QLK7_9BACI|nr:DUF2812 domain-containing protein [Cytobacillus stercorigallinarum]MBD7936357.1 DUF2812 domain-containing protein [Cytobacillus stercorigallinarum]